jgi:kumamolisin
VAVGVSILVGCGVGAEDPVGTTSAAVSSISTADVRLQELTNSCGANQAQDFFKVVNAGTTPIPASDVSIKIWVDDTSGSAIVPRIDTGGCVLDGFGSCMHQVTGVTATATRLASACGPDDHHQANWEITISTTDHTAIGAGLVWSNIQLALHLANFGNFSPGTGSWYSECGSGGGYAHVAHAAVYVQSKLVTSSSGVPPSCVAPKGAQPIPGELAPPIASGDVPLVGPLPGNTPVHLMIGLPIQNQPALDTLIQQLYDPKSPQYRKFLTPDQFGASFGVSPYAYGDLIGFAQSNGLTVVGQYAGRSMLAVTAPASVVEQAFFVTLNQYLRPDGTIFYAPANEPSANLAVPVLQISGLDSYAIPRPGSVPRPNDCGANKAKQDYVGSDFRTAYLSDLDPVLLASLDGAGQTIGLLEYDSYLPDDPGAYAAAFMSGPAPTIVNVKLPLCKTSPPSSNGADDPCDSTNYLPNKYENEAALDIEMVMAMAPKATIRVYESDPYPADSLGNPLNMVPPDIMLQQMADDRVPIISSSWQWNQMQPDKIMPNIFQQFAVQGQSFFQASMDLGAYVAGGQQPHVEEPIIMSSLMTVVGGTTLTTDASIHYVTETTWNNPDDRAPGTSLNSVSGGGFCTGYGFIYKDPNTSKESLLFSYSTLPIPSYQIGINNSGGINNPPNDEIANGAQNTRMIPDVSLVADQIAIYGADSSMTTQLLPCRGGTSAAAPLWAGLAALMNQQSLSTGGERIGFANPTLYALANPASYAANFHDVNDNSNNRFSEKAPELYHAVNGYDLATGLGTPKANLLKTLPPQSCMPGASLTALISGSDVTAYIPNGSWDEPVTGIRVVPIEGGGAGVSIATPDVVNTCSGNSVTGQVVCTSNNTDVYIINGTSLTTTLTSAGTDPESFSGGSCTTCNVAVDPLHDRAFLSIGTSTGAALQPLDLRTLTLGAPIQMGQSETSEDIAIDTVRGLALSPNEGSADGLGGTGTYQLVNTTTGAVFTFSPQGGPAVNFGFDMAAEDCSTGIALATDESNLSSNTLFLTDLTQARFYGNTWYAPFNFQTFPEFSGMGAGTAAIAVVSDAHLGVVAGEFGTASFGVIKLPSSSGSGTPAVQDWVAASLPDTPDSLPWSMGFDPHTLTAYTSPTSGRQYAVFEDDALRDGTRTFLAIVDMQALFALRPPGSHTITAPLVTCTGAGPLGTPEVPGCVVRFIQN